MSWLLDTSMFVTRSHCGLGWSPGLTFIYKFSNLVIAVAYFAIPIMIMVLWKKRRNDIAQTYILLLFAAFICSCGLTHLCNVTVFYWAPYRFYTLIEAITGILSTITVCFLPRVILDLLKLPSREVVHKLNGQLNKLVLSKKVENVVLEERNTKLRSRVQILEGMLETNAWMHDKGSALQQLKEMLLTIGPENPTSEQ